MRYITILSILALSCASCSSSRPPALTTSSGPLPKGLVISRVVGRDRVIVVRSGPNGPTYSLESKTGEVIVPAVTLGDLAMSKPELFREIRTMQANTVWAGL
jgi:hypothetical protein